MPRSSERFFPLTADDAAVGELIYRGAESYATKGSFPKLSYLEADEYFKQSNPEIYSAVISLAKSSAAEKLPQRLHIVGAAAYLFGATAMVGMIRNRADTLAIPIPKMSERDIGMATTDESMVDPEWAKKFFDTMRRLDRWEASRVPWQRALDHELAEPKSDGEMIRLQDNFDHRKIALIQGEPAVRRVFTPLIDPEGGLNSYDTLNPKSKLILSGLVEPYIYLRYALEK